MPAGRIATIVANMDDFNSTDEYVRYLAGLFADNFGEMNWLTGNLDSVNIKELTANKIMTGILNAALVTVRSALSGGAYIVIDHNGMRINDGTKDVFIADIHGQVTMTGAKVQTNTSSQSVEINPSENLFRVKNGGASVSIKPDVAGNPSLEFDNGFELATLFLGLGVFSINTVANATDITLASGKGINLNPSGGYSIRVPTWSSLYSNGNLQSLQDALNGIYARLIALETAPPPPGP